MLITVHRKSWHYRLWKFAQDPFRVWDRVTNGPSAEQLKSRAKEPTAICGYFWTLVFSPLVIFGGVVLIPAAIAAICIVIAPFYALYHGGKALNYCLRNEQGVKPTSLVATAVKSTKTRYCPRVTVAP